MCASGHWVDGRPVSAAEKMRAEQERSEGAPQVARGAPPNWHKQQPVGGRALAASAGGGTGGGRSPPHIPDASTASPERREGGDRKRAVLDAQFSNAAGCASSAAAGSSLPQVGGPRREVQPPDFDDAAGVFTAEAELREAPSWHGGTKGRRTVEGGGQAAGRKGAPAKSVQGAGALVATSE